MKNENVWVVLALVIFAVYTVVVLVFGKDDKNWENATQECIIHPGNAVYIKDMDEYICQH